MLYPLTIENKLKNLPVEIKDLVFLQNLALGGNQIEILPEEIGKYSAGQYRSELNVSRENVLQAYKEILASKYSLQAIAYRLKKGFRERTHTK